MIEDGKIAVDNNVNIKNEPHKLEKKQASIDDEYNVGVASKSFLSYFESVDVRCLRLIDFVHPDEVSEFKAFMSGKINGVSRRIFRLKRNTNEYRYNVVKLCHEDNALKDKGYRDIEIIDIEDTVLLNEKIVSDLEKMRLLFGMTDEYMFNYNKVTNVLKIFHYDELKRVIDYNMDIDEWSDEMLQKRYVADNERGLFKAFIIALKDYNQSISTKINCSIRTHGNIIETLRFTGIYYNSSIEGEGEIIGRILSDGATARSNEALELMDELQYDSLTKVYNKKAITEYAINTLKENKRNRTIIVILDVDHFKSVNDTYGHMYGDKILARVGQRLKEVVGEDGVVGRIGGDEFMIVLNGINDDQMLRGVLRAMRTQIKWEFSEEFTDFMITCSIGASIYPNNGTDFEELFKKADHCLYIAKEKGRDRYVFFRDELHRESYEASVEKKDSQSISSRENKELEYLGKFFAEVAIDREKAIRDMFAHMKTAYNIDSIDIYYGDGLKAVYSFGADADKNDDAMYVYSSEFKEMLGNNRSINVSSLRKIMENAPDFCTEMKKRSILSTIQCIIGSQDDIKGLITFNKKIEASQWADYEVTCAEIAASYLRLFAENKI
ncbi:MAG: GGDEF domain-containing protein [Lachnospira sp.]